MAVESFPLGLILLFPALGLLFNLFVGRRAGRTAVDIAAASAIGAAFLVGLAAFIRLLAMPRGAALTCFLWPWLEAGKFHVDVALRFDSLTAVMVLVVSGVGTLIHIYSAGYMAEDEDYARYFTYLNLFVLSMLTLVLADNLLLMFVGWEGVGLCSYLLIAFWYTNPQFAYNGRKAFIVNRIGDAGFVLGILTLVSVLAGQGVWTVNFAEIHSNIGMVNPVMATVIGVLLFVGATGKSAQIPLYVWLPDAMVGPTPVSALIHAATMVTAGVYMIARLHFLYVVSPDAMEVVGVIGALTCFFAATVAFTQPDIKRVLAYSTISQLGYMFLGVGVGAFSAGIFHLMTHAFFKSLLFLCSGSVIHSMSGEQDMNKMGGLAKKMPITCLTMWSATLAIVAIPPFSGFFSKDLILSSAYASGHFWLWLLGVITAGLTGLYMFRLMLMTFHGESRVDPQVAHHVHESPPVMTIPLMVLAVLALIGGWVGLPEGFLWGNVFTHFVSASAGVFKPIMEVNDALLSAISVALALSGAGIAYLFYIARPGLPTYLAWRVKALYQLLLDKYYIDQIYDALVSKPLFFIAQYVLFMGVDRFAIDGVVDGTGLTVEAGGDAARRVETGNVQHYALVYLLGAVAIGAFYLYRVLH
jgi:NADH-quinone oxidoreductase subunit L